jgi:hypothetical protein
MNPIAKWWHKLWWRSHQTIVAAWTFRDKHYFVVDGALYLLVTNGSRNPGDWMWTLVTYL